ncbi:MAG: hydroxymethylbilane synthase, partial [Sideroxydans sp.]
IRTILSSEDSLPAVGQGALGIETRADRADLKTLLAPLHHADTATCVLAERAMSRALAGSCQVPLGGFAEMQADGLRMRGFVATPDGSRMLRAEHLGDRTQPEALGDTVAQDLLRQGAGEILAALSL